MNRVSKSAFGVVVLCVVVQVAMSQDCNEHCNLYDYQCYFTSMDKSTHACGRYTPAHARGDTITFSSGGDETKAKHSTDIMTEYTRTNIDTCAPECPEITPYYGQSKASSFVINDPETEVVQVSQYPRKICLRVGS